METELNDYAKAIANHMKAQADYAQASKEVQLSRYKLVKAREALRYKEHELLELN